MPHQTQNFSIHAGDDLLIPVEVTDNGLPTTDPDDPGTPIDLTGAAEITFAVSQRNEARTRGFTYKLTTTGITLIDAANGRYDIKIDNLQSFGLKGWFLMQDRITDAVGDRFTGFSGLLEVEESILTATE